MSKPPKSIYRHIHLAVWTDEKFRRLSGPTPNGKDLWVYLLAAKESVIIPGLIPAGAGTIADTLNWTEKSVKKVFSEISGEGMAKADWQARLVWVPNAIRYNPPKAPNVIRGWKKAWKAVPECPLRAEIFSNLKAYVDGMTEGFREAFAEVFTEDFPGAFAKALPPRHPPKTSPEDLPPRGAPKAWGNTVSSEQGAVEEAFSGAPVFEPDAQNFCTPAFSPEPAGELEQDEPKAELDPLLGPKRPRDISHLGGWANVGVDVEASDARSREIRKWTTVERKSRGLRPPRAEPTDDALADWYFMTQAKHRLSDRALRDAYLHFLDDWGLRDGRDGSLALFISSENVWLQRALDMARAEDSEARPKPALRIKRGGR